MVDGYNPVFPPRPAPVCCRLELWPLLGPSQATPLLATMLTLDTDQTRKAHTTLRQLKTTVLLDINQRRFWSPLSIAYDLLIRSKYNVNEMSMQNYVTIKSSDVNVKSHLH